MNGSHFLLFLLFGLLLNKIDSLMSYQFLDPNLERTDDKVWVTLPETKNITNCELQTFLFQLLQDIVSTCM